MPRKQVVNHLDLYGAVAVLAFYLRWASYQIASGERSAVEVHLALAGALLGGLAYRLFRRKLSPMFAELIARGVFLLAGLLVQNHYVTESVVLVASANLEWLLRGARLKRLRHYASSHVIVVLYLLLLFVPLDSGVTWIIGLIVAMTALETPVYVRSVDQNPYLAIFPAVILLFALIGGIWLLIAPTAETATQRMAQRLMAGFGVSILLVVALMVLKEWRRGFGDSRPPDAGVLAPLSPVRSTSAGNAQRLPEER